MTVLTRAYSEVDDTIAEASSVNRVIDDLYTLVNGSLDSANISVCGVSTMRLQISAVETDKVNNCAITTVKLDDCAIANSKINNNVIQFKKMDYEATIFSNEVF